jgi:toxin YoeB
MKSIRFELSAYQDFIQWSIEDKVIFKKITQIVKDIDRNSFQGIGKPEALKYGLTGWWSRRITEYHRIVYKVEDDVIIILSCKGHYIEQ